MARRSGRLSEIAKASPAAASFQKNGSKRAMSDDDDESVTPRASKKQKQSKVLKTTPKKSRYFSNSKKDDSPDLESPSPEPSLDGEESDFAADSAPGSEPSDRDEDEDDDFSEEERKPARKKARPSKTNGRQSLPQGNGDRHELWRQGADTGAAVGTEVVIKKPKARAAGKTPYKDETVHPNTLLFLGDLKRNNDREWLKSESSTFTSCDSRS